MGEVNPLDVFGPPYERDGGSSNNYFFYFVVLPKTNFQVFEHTKRLVYRDGVWQSTPNQFKSPEELDRFKAAVQAVSCAGLTITTISSLTLDLYRNYHHLDGQPFGSSTTKWLFLTLRVINVKNPTRLSKTLCGKIAKAMNLVEKDHIVALEQAHMM